MNCILKIVARYILVLKVDWAVTPELVLTTSCQNSHDMVRIGLDGGIGMHAVVT